MRINNSRINYNWMNPIQNHENLGFYEEIKNKKTEDHLGLHG